MSTVIERRATHDGPTERSLGDLLRELTHEVQGLVRAEVQLARIEMRDELVGAKEVALKGAVAGLAAFLAVLLLSMAAAWGLAEIMPVGVAFAIVGVVDAVIALFAFMAARQQARDVDVVPQQTVQTLQEDAQWLRARSK